MVEGGVVGSFGTWRRGYLASTSAERSQMGYNRRKEGRVRGGGVLYPCQCRLGDRLVSVSANQPFERGIIDEVKASPTRLFPGRV